MPRFSFRSLLSLSACVALGLLPSARADVKLPSVFGSHMVLQRDQPDKVYGTADPGEEVSVSIADQTKTTKADDKGRWSVTLDALKTSTKPLTMTVKGKNTVTFDDVLVGEVWICSGQSNMGFNLGSAYDADIEALTAKLPNLRLISVPQVGTQEPQDDFKGHWEPCTPEAAKSFSAVGFFFGRQIYETLDNVPVGLIDDAWGGSAAEAWVRRDILEKDPKYKDLIASWEEREKQYEEAKSKGDEQKVKQLQGQMTGNHRPGNIYNGVLKPTIGYGIRGAIWYQGESNAGRAYQYRDLFPLMIQSWRDEWGIGDFPFYWVQLADFMAEKGEPSDSAWAELREAQTMTMDRLPNTGQAVIIDVGEGRDIHPRNKRDVGKRLARWALAKVYGVDVPYQSPTYKSMEAQGSKVIVTFDHVGPGGLYSFDTPEVQGFTLAGEDKVFHNARAKVVGPDKVEVTSEDVSHPVAVRYAWADNPVVNLYGKGSGLPATPFRSDDWKGVTAESTR
ncbi:MAG TPA: sialate O-acetylesterase [Isosphaeraceae bacterium]|nr:sialate O-acetylesterase [Isosphaeraceae bacterium]